MKYDFIIIQRAQYWHASRTKIQHLKKYKNTIYVVCTIQIVQSILCSIIRDEERSRPVTQRFVHER